MRTNWMATERALTLRRFSSGWRSAAFLAATLGFCFSLGPAVLPAAGRSQVSIHGTTGWDSERRPEFSLRPQLTRYEALSWMAASASGEFPPSAYDRCDVRPCRLAEARAGSYRLDVAEPGAWWVDGGMDHWPMYVLPVLGPSSDLVVPVLNLDPGEPCWLSLEEPEAAWVLGVESELPHEASTWRPWRRAFPVDRFGADPVWPRSSGGSVRVAARGRETLSVNCEPGERVELRLPVRDEPTVEVTLLRGGEALAGAVLVSESGWPECLTEPDGRCSAPRGLYSVVTADQVDAVIEVIGDGIHDVPSMTKGVEGAAPATVTVGLARVGAGPTPEIPEVLFAAHWSRSGELLAHSLEHPGNGAFGLVDLRVSRHPGAARTSLSALGYENAWIEWDEAPGRIELRAAVGERLGQR